MRARPGRIKADICIELPHPRRYTVKATPVFSDYEAALTEEIRVESIKTVQWEWSEAQLDRAMFYLNFSSSPKCQLARRTCVFQDTKFEF